MNPKPTKSRDQDLDDPDFIAIVPRLRPARAIHPESTSAWEKPLKWKQFKKVALSDQSSYHEFAWEFLRRNRFYQAMVDGRKNAISDSRWGYRWDTHVQRSHGLLRLKPYWEPYQVGQHPSWTGLDSFVEQLPKSTNMNYTTVSLQLRPGQVAVVFDVAGCIAGQSPWEQQAWAIHQQLQRLCQQDFGAEPIGGKPVHRKVLIRRLELFDLISAHTRMKVVATQLAMTYGRERASRSKTEPKGFFKHLLPSQPLTTAFDDATEAYNLVYRHGYRPKARRDSDRGHQSSTSSSIFLTLLAEFSGA